MERLLNRNIAVSILNCRNKENFLKKLRKICDENNYKNVTIHIDVMDKDFVNGEGISISNVSLAKKLGFYTDVHLMVNSPREYIDELAYMKADSITIHVEINNIDENIEYLNEMKKNGKISNIGLAIKPNTKSEMIYPYIDSIDMILVMTVEPGYGMQEYINDVEPKIKDLSKFGKMLQVDGGINDKTITRAKNLNVNSFVVGSFFTKNEDELSKNLNKMMDLIEG